MTDLSQLPASVREAVERIDTINADTPYGTLFVSRIDWQTIRAELLKVTDERDELARRIAEAPVALLDYDVTWPEEMCGQRVALVRVDK